MFAKPKRRVAGLTLWKGAVGAFALAVGPCGDLQRPPAHTELILGVAIARGEEVPAPTVPVQDDIRSFAPPACPAEQSGSASGLAGVCDERAPDPLSAQAEAAP